MNTEIFSFLQKMTDKQEFVSPKPARHLGAHAPPFRLFDFAITVPMVSPIIASTNNKIMIGLANSHFIK
jgi:hypothetical protein